MGKKPRIREIEEAVDKILDILKVFSPEERQLMIEAMLPELGNVWTEGGRETHATS